MNEEKVDELFEVIAYEAEKIKKGEISDKEIEEAKSYALGRLQTSIQTMGQLNQWLGESYFLDGRIEDFAEQPEKIKAVTREKIVAIANEFIDTKCWGIGIYGNANKALAEKLHEKLRGVYE